ncbi:MAG TPA: helix-turn-helix domain-containing protein, partial [Kiloniellales bacterium]|nr:helix-turn-helix domain-containing protein [Kiloniellales bacterium]
RARSLLDAGEASDSVALERETGLDRFALARQFRRAWGTSPHRYLVLRRLERARAAIGAGESLAAAATLAGFADQAHLTRQFKRAYGLTPGRWRALGRGGGGHDG